MNKSLFLVYVEKYFNQIVSKISDTIRGEKETEQFLHKHMLHEEYSADMNWGTAAFTNSIVSADLVDLDSAIPLKQRTAIISGYRKIPKLAIKYRKGERDITTINLMKASGTSEYTIVSKIFEDTPKVIKGIDIAKEIMFQQGLSTGVALAPGADSDDNGVRISYGYLDDNILQVYKEWSNDESTPISDLSTMFAKAENDGNTIGVVMLSKKYFDLLRSSDEAKDLAANFRNIPYTDITVLPIPLRSTLLEALEDEFGAKFQIVNSTFRVEAADGTRTSVKPWAEANIVALPEEHIGRLVYGSLAEESNPIADVTYQKAGSHILISKYSKNDPLEEYTSAQAIVVPVIDGADTIYLMKADDAMVSEENEEDYTDL